MAGWTTVPNPDTSAWKPVAQPPSASQPQPTMSATPPSEHPVQDWLHNVETDVTQGGNRTLPGRILGHMQGRGDEGYTGLNAGQGPTIGRFMGSPILGPIHAAQGIAETPQHPIMGPIHAGEGALETMTIPGLMMGGEGLEAAAEMLPSRARAAAKLSDIESAAKEVPVSMSATKPALGEFQQSVATGGKNAPVMTKLARRMEPPVPRSTMLGNMQSELNGVPTGAPEPTPINFPEARDYYSNISRATAKPGFLRSAIESPNMPAFRYNAGNVRAALNTDLTDAAGTIGRGDDYTGAMNEYRRAAQLNKAVKIGGGVAAGEALRRSGILGKVAGGIANATQ